MCQVIYFKNDLDLNSQTSDMQPKGMVDALFIYFFISFSLIQFWKNKVK